LSFGLLAQKLLFILAYLEKPGRGGEMKRGLTKIVGSVVLSGTLLGGSSYQAYAQDGLNKEVRREAKRERRMQRDYEKLQRWTERIELKRASQLTKQQRFDTPYTARGSEVGYIDSRGMFVFLGYMDKRNDFRSYR
jgi:hypothetical protein